MCALDIKSVLDMLLIKANYLLIYKLATDQSALRAVSEAERLSDSNNDDDEWVVYSMN